MPGPCQPADVNPPRRGGVAPKSRSSKVGYAPINRRPPPGADDWSVAGSLRQRLGSPQGGPLWHPAGYHAKRLPTRGRERTEIPERAAPGGSKWRRDARSKAIRWLRIMPTDLALGFFTLKAPHASVDATPVDAALRWRIGSRGPDAPRNCCGNRPDSNRPLATAAPVWSARPGEIGSTLSDWPRGSG